MAILTWTEFVKKYAKEHNISYACALSVAKDDYAVYKLGDDVVLEEKQKQLGRVARSINSYNSNLTRILDKRDSFASLRNKATTDKEKKNYQKMVDKHQKLAKSVHKKYEAKERDYDKIKADIEALSKAQKKKKPVIPKITPTASKLEKDLNKFESKRTKNRQEHMKEIDELISKIPPKASAKKKTTK